MADCPAFEQLVDFVDGSIQYDHRPPVEQHVTTCESCSSAIESIRADLVLGERLRGMGGLIEQTAARQIVPSVAGYQLLHELGRGGMGVVYAAEQTHPKRKVALKLLRGGGFLHAEHRSLFRREIEALSRLHHPDIATLYGAGETAAGDPYLAMEFVDGLTLVEYSKRANLSRRSRLELIARIARAVHYAHQQGVIHRDLKPSNVLVERTGRPVILDFGLAKLLESEHSPGTEDTLTGVLRGTPAFMSPEQASGAGGINTSSDIYALGVLAFLILTDELPHRVHGLTMREAAHRVATEAPRRPSAVLPELRGDIETILLKALQAEPQDRYASAAELAADLDRYLNSQPISARRPSALYQLERLIARHRLSSAVTLAIFAGALVVAVWMRSLYAQEKKLRLAADLASNQANLANIASKAEAERARREAEKTGRALEFMVGLFESGTPNRALGRIPDAHELLDRGVGLIRSQLKEDSEVRFALLSSLGRCYFLTGGYQQAEVLLREGLELAQGLSEELPERQAEIGHLLATLLKDKQAFDEARTLCEQSLMEKLPAALRASLLGTLASVLSGQGDYQGAIERFREAIRLTEEAKDTPSGTAAVLRSNLAIPLFWVGRVEDARHELELAVSDLQGHPERASDLLAAQDNLAVLYSQSGSIAEAVNLRQKVLDRQLEIGMGDTRDYALVLHNQALDLERLNQYEEAEAALRDAIDVLRRAFGEEHGEVAAELGVLAGNLWMQGKVEDAREISNQARIMRAQLEVPDDPQAVELWRTLGRIEEHDGNLELAAEAYRQVIAIGERVLPPAQNNLGRTRKALGEVLIKLGRREEALHHLRIALLELPGLRGEADSLESLRKQVAELEQSIAAEVPEERQ